jgi:anti-sigma factor RsiW
VKLSDEKINDYLDGRLSTRETAVVAATLAANPHLMRDVMTMRLVDEMVRCLGQRILDEPVPDRLNRIVRPGKPQRRSTATLRSS